MDLSVNEIRPHMSRYVLIDVREPYELTGPEGQIEGSRSFPLGPGLETFLAEADPQKKYVFICRSGVRSAHATTLARNHGLSAYNMAGGMLVWNEGS